MKVMMMNLESAEDIQNRMQPAGRAYMEACGQYFQKVGHKMVGGNPLDVDIAPMTLRRVDGKRQVQDGPFADSRESLGGYCILEVDSLEEAMELASANPCLDRGAVTLHVLAEMKKNCG